MICPLCHGSHSPIELNFAGTKHRLIPCDKVDPGKIYMSDNLDWLITKSFEVTVERLKEISRRYSEELESETRKA